MALVSDYFDDSYTVVDTLQGQIITVIHGWSASQVDIQNLQTTYSILNLFLKVLKPSIAIPQHQDTNPKW